ncbi:hypothetical protein G7Y89_g4424 [Cudoniella acicularis]|uniref:Uncharacterized protein n=1 Tax=Cudoniella acicularis TaxID=354080 RepID=A0A8H4RSG5_9HELO|nr:hypothetical protein G7Y89_g4424 [Cudoniella acicularis]
MSSDTKPITPTQEEAPKIFSERIPSLTKLTVSSMEQSIHPESSLSLSPHDDHPFAPFNSPIAPEALDTVESLDEALIQKDESSVEKPEPLVTKYIPSQVLAKIEEFYRLREEEGKCANFILHLTLEKAGEILFDVVLQKPEPEQEHYKTFEEPEKLKRIECIASSGTGEEEKTVSTTPPSIQERRPKMTEIIGSDTVYSVTSLKNRDFHASVRRRRFLEQGGKHEEGCIFEGLRSLRLDFKNR